MKLTILITVLCGMAAQAFGQKHELGFTLGRLLETDRGVVLSKTGTALQVNYGYRFWGNSAVAISGEVHMLASPQRLVAGPATSSGDYASLYLTPGIRLKLNPKGRVQPYGVIGAGYALYEHSTLTVGGLPNPAPRHTHEGAVVYGGGVDVPVLRWLALRAEVRDFYTGSPDLSATLFNSSRQHNVVAGGGFVLRFGD